MSATIHDHLTFLYGQTTANQVLPALTRLITRHGSSAQSRSGRRHSPLLTGQDALLITYGDQFREPDEAPLATLAAFGEEHLQGVVSGLHILPFYPYSSDDGFSVKDYFAVDPALGTWTDVARLGSSFDLMFDAVFNHLSTQSQWFQQFLADDPRRRDFFVAVEGQPDLSQVVRPRTLPLLTEFPSAAGPRRVWTTFSADQVDLNFKNPEVLLAVLEALLWYVAKGARFIRLDAIAYLWKEIGTPCIHLPQTHRLIQLLRAVLDEVAPHVRLITETNVPHADNVSYFGDGTNEAQLVYNFALPPLVLHSLQTGSAAALRRWAATLRTPSDRTTFFNFLASHDGIGVNAARGLLSDAEIEALIEQTKRHGGRVSYKTNPDATQSPYELNITYFDALNDPHSTEPLETQLDRFMVSQAIMLALAGVPGIYVHSLFGSRNDAAAVEATGIPRRINRRKFQRAELERWLAQPHSLEAQVFARYRELLRVRRSHSAFHPHAPQRVWMGDERVFALERVSLDEREAVLCLHNLTQQGVALTLNWPTSPSGAEPTVLYGGDVTLGLSGGSLAVTLRPLQTLWIRR